MQISSLSQSTAMKNSIANIQTQLADLQQQLTTGYKADTYAKLGSATSVVLSLNNQVSQSNSYINTINTVQLRIQTSADALTSINSMASSVKTGSLTSSFNLSAGTGTQTSFQTTAGAYLDQMVSLLNQNVADRYLFGGKDTQTTPVVSTDLMLNGDTAHAGLKTVIAERAKADLGADGMGRLSTSTPTADSVSLTEDTGVFGFKLSSVSSNLTGATVTGPTGSPASLNVQFGSTLPTDGDTISLDMKLPDGTTTTIKLTATTKSPAGAGQFSIGADAATTAANFQSALTTSIKSEAGSTLKAASAVQAGNDFFGNPPQRVSGSDPYTATALQDGTTADTVFWYQGDTSGTAGDNFVATVGDGQQIAYGARADQSAIATALKAAAVISVVQYDATDTNAAASYSALTQRTATALNYKGTQSIEGIVTKLGLQSSNLDSTKASLQTQISTSQSLLGDNLNANDYEVSTKLTTLMTQLQASYQITSSLSKLSLVSYM